MNGNSEAVAADITTERLKISALEPGMEFEDATFVLSEPSIAVSARGTKYLGCRLQDLTGKVSAKRWDVEREDILEHEGKVLAFTGKVEDYKGSPQVVFESARVVEDYDPADFVRTSKIPRVEREAALGDWMVELDGELGTVVGEMFSDPYTWNKFLEVPAAQSYHHAWDGGLSEHVLSMLQAALPLGQHYAELYPGLVDIDLLLAGVFLHDFGKVWDFERRGLSWVPTPRSVLVQHMATCVEQLGVAYAECGTSERTRSRLTHLILSHHGNRYNGSPVDPSTIEATILHHVDMMDSRAPMFADALEGLEEDEVSDWVRPLRGRVVR